MKKENEPIKEPKIQITMRITESTDERIRNICSKNGATYNSLSNIALGLGLSILESEFSCRCKEKKETI